MQNNTLALMENGTFSSSSAEVSKVAKYDHVGAMHFIVATILVYSTIGVCCTLVVRIKRSHNRKSHTVHTQDEHIQKYLKQEKYLKQDGFKMKLSFECEKTRQHLSETDGRVRLLELQKAVTCSDFSTDKRSKKKHRRKRRGKSRLDSLVEKMGFSLVYVPEVESFKFEETEMKENGYITGSADSSVSNTPSQSTVSIPEATTLPQNSSRFLIKDQTYTYQDDIFPSACLSMSSTELSSCNE